MPPQLERRDNTLLEAVLQTNKLLAEQGKELASNTTETRLLKEEVKALNGKVVGHETRLQASEVNQTLMAQVMQNVQNREDVFEATQKERTTFWQRNQDKMIWMIVGVILMLFWYLLKNNGFPDFLK